MATAETEEPVERTLEKEVVMVGYFDEQKTHMSRFKSLVTGVDLESTEVTKTEHWEFIIDLSDAFEDDGAVFEWKTYTETQKDRTLEGLQRKGLENVAEVKHRVEESSRLVNDEWAAKKELRKELFSTLPKDLPPNLTKDEGHGSYKPQDSMESKIKVRIPEFDRRRVLAKESERDSDSLYETIVDYPSVELHINLYADSQELIDLYTEEVIAGLHKALSKREGIGKVRYTSCTTREEKSGECYDI